MCVVGFLHDLQDGMLYLHDVKHIIHRDLKPDNLFVRTGAGGPQIHHQHQQQQRQQRPVLVIGDVGLAKQVTRTMSLVSAAGAVAYRAPEAMVDAARCSAASDVYTASLCAVEIVTGKQVYGACGDDTAAKRALVERAKAKMVEVLDFAEDSDMTVASAHLLLGACTITAPAERPTFTAIVAARSAAGNGNNSNANGRQQQAPQAPQGVADQVAVLRRQLQEERDARQAEVDAAKREVEKAKAAAAEAKLEAAAGEDREAAADDLDELAIANKKNKKSWQAYIEKSLQGGGALTDSCIMGRTDCAVWALSLIHI